MRSKAALIAMLLTLLIGTAAAQKVKVGFDKSVDFSKYHSYSWAKPSETTEVTVRRAAVIGEIDDILKSKGLQLMEEGGDLLVSGSGGFGGEMGGQHGGVLAPSPSSLVFPTTTMWTGVPVAAGSVVVKGTLLLQFVDRSTSSLVWQGTVSQKIETDNRPKNLELIRTAISKLLAQFPPKR